MNLFRKIFGMEREEGKGFDEKENFDRKKDRSSKNRSLDKKMQSLLKESLKGLITRGGFDLKFEIQMNPRKSGMDLKQTLICFSGGDESLLKDRDGALLDAFQLYLLRVLQHNFPMESPQILCDVGGYREKINRDLIEAVEKLRDRALEQNKSVYLRQLSPQERKLVHRFLAEDQRIKSRSIGEGLYKKIKIYPVRHGSYSSPGS